MAGGPQPLERKQRLALVQEIADRALVVYQKNVRAIGLYGSTARGTDGPFSDIELFCVLDTTGEKYIHEWTHGSWKAEVDVISEDVLLARASQVDERWPLTHGCYFDVQALYDPNNFFAILSHIASSQPEEKFFTAIRELMLFNLYEYMGKLRNAYYQENKAYLPEVACNIAKCGALLVGLAHQHCYTTASHMLEESLLLHQQPAGYDALCQLVMSGDLREPRRIVEICEAFWTGAEQWAVLHTITIEEPCKIPF